MNATHGDDQGEQAQALPVWKRALYWALTFGAMAIVVALLGEAMVRLLAPQAPVEGWFEESEAYRYVLKKDFHQRFPFVGSDFVMDVRTNALGLRDQEFDPTASFDGKTILLIGDSFVFGYGINVEDRFDTKLRALIDAVGLPIRVANAGVPGWGTIQETAYAKDHLDLFKPDIIVLTFCGNDPHDDALFTSGEMVYREGGLFWFPGKRFLRAHSRLYSFLLRSTTQLRRRIALRGQLDETPEAHVDEQSASVIADDEWEETRALILQFHEAFLAHNPAGLLLVQCTSPMDETIGANLAELDNGGDLRYVDLTERASQLAPEERQLSFDRHWSPAMHAVSAEGIFEFLRAGT